MNTEKGNMPEKQITVSCEIEVTLHLIGGKCKPLILYLLCESSPLRFSELRARIQQISQKTLTNQLRELEADGLIQRTVFAEVPPRVEYAITEKGHSLLPILELMCHWGEQYRDNRFVLHTPQCV